MIKMQELSRNDLESEFNINNLIVKLDNKNIFSYIKNLQYTDDITISTLDGQTKILYKMYKNLPTLENNNFKTPVYEYQLQGINYTLSSGQTKWLLLDAPGLGKTLQMIYLAQELKERNEIDHCLVICGVNTLKHNWKSEIEKHSNLSSHILGSRISKKGTEKIGGNKEKLEDLKKYREEFFTITNIESLRDSNIVK